MSEEARCGNCRHWRKKPWVNKRMEAEAVQAGIANGNCGNPKSPSTLTAAGHVCDYHEGKVKR